MAKIVSLYGGLGGLEFGFKRAGFDVVCGNEVDETIRNIFVSNFPGSFCYNSNLDGVCTCGFKHRNPLGIVGQIRDEHDRGHFSRILAATKPAFFVAVADGGLVDTNRNDELTKITDDLGSKGYDIFVEWMDEYDYGSQFSKSYTYIVGFTQESEVQNFVFPEKTVVRDSGPNAYAVDPVTLPSSQLLEEKGLAPEYNLFGHENEPAVNQAIIDTISPNVGEALARAISKVKVTVMKKIGEF